MILIKSVFVEYPLDMTVHEFTLGKKCGRGTPVELLYHQPSGEGDAHYVDVKFDDGDKIRIFKPNEIEFLKVEV